MRRTMLRWIPSVLLGLGVLAAQPLSAGAQEGVTVEALARGAPPEASGQQLTLLRATFAPDSVLRLHRHPGPMLLYIESGALTYTLVDGMAEITRAGSPAGGTAPETLLSGQGTVLDVGDQLLERGVLHAAHNAGADPAVVLIAALFTPGQPLTQFVEVATQP